MNLAVPLLDAPLRPQLQGRHWLLPQNPPQSPALVMAAGPAVLLQARPERLRLLLWPNSPQQPAVSMGTGPAALVRTRLEQPRWRETQ